MVLSVAIRERGGGRQLQYGMVVVRYGKVWYGASYCDYRGPTLVINPMVRSVAIRERGGGRQLQYGMVMVRYGMEQVVATGGQLW